MEPMDRDWRSLLAVLLRGEDLTTEDTAWVMGEVMGGRAPQASLAGFLVALQFKAVTVAELDGLLRGVQAHSVPVRVPAGAVDIVGTGGDGAHTVNISTMSAIVAAAAGARVVKHGNRSVSSRSGSADLLERLGLPLELSPAQIATLMDEVGIAFCFAPHFHPAMRHAAPVRRQLGVPTVFNLLGPLSNPAQPSGYAVGVADRAAAPLVAGVLAHRGVEALVFRGDDGLDELTISTTSRVWTVREGRVHEEVFDPAEVGIGYAPVETLRTEGPEHSAAVARQVLTGTVGPVRDAVLLSAAAGLAATDGRAEPIGRRLATGLDRARTAIDSGRAADLLRRWVEIAGKLAAEG